MPTFPERESGILAKMKSKGGNPELSEFKVILSSYYFDYYKYYLPGTR
jgi:hypothetical protein